MDETLTRMDARRSDVSTRTAEDDRVGYGNKPLNEIEEDIARTRVRLSATIEAIEQELAPERVVEKGANLLRSALDPPPGPFHQQVWAYAIPLALIATGLGWLFLLRRRVYQERASSIASELPAEAIEAGETPVPAPPYVEVAGPIEPVPLVNENTAI